MQGQGVASAFRPQRNDLGILNDPAYSYNSSSSNSYGAEVGLGAYVHAGISTNKVYEKIEDGPWYTDNYVSGLDFTSSRVDQIQENVFYKPAGDRVEINNEKFNGIGAYDPITFKLDGHTLLSELKRGSNSKISQLPSIKEDWRNPRSQVLSTLTAVEAEKVALDGIKSITGKFYQGGSEGYNIEDISRVGGIRKEHHISEITYLEKDGRRYVYGIPAYNKSKHEVTYTTGKESPSIGDNRVAFGDNEASIHNDAGIDGYYSKIKTPPYAHSFLLTAQLSPDYQDLTGNGVTPDDLGNAYKFNYTKTSDNYKWRMPYSGDNFHEGYKTDDLDQKATYTYGTKEMWYMHSIESKNQVAEFYTSPRKDAVGVKGEEGEEKGVAPTDTSDNNRSFKLDSIVLYDKLDRLVNKEEAIPLKRVIFDYDYSLCENVEGQIEVGKGKLTLQSIEILNGNSNNGKKSPYLFIYSNVNPDYNPDAVDRWGNYKPKSVNPDGIKNADFPYSPQEYTDSLNTWANAWSLKEIITPIGGKINVEYEADDYAFIQDKTAMQMYPVIGAGSSKEYASSDNLYGNKYLYMNTPSSIASISSELNNTALKRLLLDGEQMYFKFLTDIGSGFEYVPGYTTVSDIGFCNNDSTKQHIYIELKSNEEGITSVSEIAWGFFRQNLFEVLYEQPNVDDNALESVLKGMKANIGDILNLFVGVEDRLRQREIANKFKVNKSFVRLNNADGYKKGGGSRVKSLTVNDNWKKMSGEGENSSYGQYYIYEIDDENKGKISSGVASYEPLVGNDENPFREPVPFISQARNGHVPVIKGYQEKPFGESFFASPVVGYSKVTVKNINYGKGKTSNKFTDYEYYTAKDFPSIVREVDIQKNNDPDNRPMFSFPFSNATVHSKFSASQGYVIILNDMHGKPKAENEYTLVEKEENGKLFQAKKDLNGTTYFYKWKEVPEGKMLDNKVRVLTTEGKVEEKEVGVDYDVAVYNRRGYTESKSTSNQFNVDVIPLPGPFPVPVPLIMPGYNRLTEKKETRLATVTKVIQMYGTADSVISYTDQYQSTAYNRLFDGKTGEVLLTETKDEHKQNEFTYEIPAHTIEQQKRMGAAFENIGFTTQIKREDSVKCDSNDNSYTDFQHLKHGDEVLIQTSSDMTAYNNEYRGWINKKQPNAITMLECDESFDYRKANPRTRILTFWNKDYYEDVGKGIYRKGERGEILEDAVIYQMSTDFVEILNQTIKRHDGLMGWFRTQGCYRHLGARNCPRMVNLLNGMLENTIFDEWDLSKELPNNIDTLEVSSLFDFSDSIKLKVECIKTKETFQNSLFNYSKKYNSCIEDSSFFLKARADLYSWGVQLQFLSGYYSTSATVFRIPITKMNISSKAPFVLVKYKIRLPNNEIDYAYYIERVLEFKVPIKRGHFFPTLCDKDYETTYNEIWDTLNIPPPPIDTGSNYEQVFCPNTYQILSREGTPIANLSEADNIKVIRSGNRNQLNHSMGALESSKDPIKIKDGYYEGTKSAEEINIFQATSNLYSDSFRVNHAYKQPINKFLQGVEGNFHAKQKQRYVSSRVSKESIEVAKDGYFEELPTLWTKNPCYDYIEASFVNEESSSGWKTEEVVEMYSASGKPMQSKNASGIYSCADYTQRDKLKALAWNSTYSNIASDNFENNYLFGTHQYSNSEKFKVCLPPQSLTHQNVLAQSNETYYFAPYEKNVQLVKGIAHSGDYSLYLKGEHNQSTVTLQYKEQHLTPLSSVTLGGFEADEQETINLDYSSILSEHINQFNQNLKQSVTTQITSIDGNGNNIHLLTLGKDSINGNFSPTSGDYLFSVWVKDRVAPGTPYTGVSPKVEIIVGTDTIILKTQAEVIDGWQKIEGRFSYDELHYLKIRFHGGLWGAFYDDFRIHPYESNMNTYVYDRFSNRLTAKLDENNYATFYDYDEEGLPSRVRRETAAGIITISESRQANNRHLPQ